MPGKHAPQSSKSFLLSLAAAAGGALAALGLVIGVVLVAVNSGGDKAPAAGNPVVSPSPSSAPSVSPTPTTVEQGIPVLPPARVSLAVLNGTPRAGLAKKFKDRAAKEGYPVLRIGNAKPTAKSTIFYRADARNEALQLQRTFGELTVLAEVPSDLASDVLLTVVLGADYPA
jgi:hypothetical protein